MSFQIPCGYRLSAIAIADFIAPGSGVVAKLFNFAKDARAARVVVVNESGESTPDNGFDVLFMKKRRVGIVAAAGGFDITFADSLADTVERYLGLNSKRMEHAVDGSSPRRSQPIRS